MDEQHFDFALQCSTVLTSTAMHVAVLNGKESNVKYISRSQSKSYILIL